MILAAALDLGKTGPKIGITSSTHCQAKVQSVAPSFLLFEIYISLNIEKLLPGTWEAEKRWSGSCFKPLGYRTGSGTTLQSAFLAPLNSLSFKQAW